MKKEKKPAFGLAATNIKIKYILSKIKEHGISYSLRKIFHNFSFGKFPETINIEIMTICNLKCKHCRVTYHGNLIPGVKLEMMELDLFKKIVDRISLLIKHAAIFQFSTIEPLFHKKIFEMMDYVSRYNKHISYPMLSNGMMLNEDNILNLCSRNVPSITISLDGCRRETVESFKTGADFDRIIYNIKLINKLSKSRFVVNTVFVATSKNIEELLEYVDFCSDLGIANIFVNGFFSYLPELSDLCLYTRTGNSKVYELFIKAYEKAREKGIFIQFPSLIAKPRGCGLTSYMCIDENGNVAPCIHLARETPFSLFSNSKIISPVIYGNVLENDPNSIWNNKEYVKFRNKLRHCEIPNECTLCADAYGVICSNRKLTP